MSFPIYRHDKSWDAWVGRADDNDARWSTVKPPSIWKRLRSTDRRDTHLDLETIDAVAMTSEPADEAAEASETPERDSFWKRERSFGRRKSGDEPQNDEVELELSWWSRRSDEDQATAVDHAAHADDSGDQGEQASPADELTPADEKQSIWKRELSFGRKAEETNAPVEPALGIEPEPELTGVSAGFEQHVGDLEPRADDSGVQAEVEAAPESVGRWPQSPTAAVVGMSDESEAPSTDIDHPTFSSGQPGEARHADADDHVESDGLQSPQTEVAADDDGPTDEYAWWSRRSDEDRVTADDHSTHAHHPGDELEEDAAADERAPSAEKQSIWKRELSFGREAENGNASVEPRANDSIAQAGIEATAEPVGRWPQSPSTAAAGPSEESEAPSTDAESPTFASQSAEVPNDVQEDVESAWSQGVQAEAAADEGPVDEYEDETDERMPDAERQSIWKRELRFGRRTARRADDGQLDRTAARQVGHTEADQPRDAAAYGASVVDETPELSVDTPTHDATAGDRPARPTRRRSPLGRSRRPRTPKAPAAEKSSPLAKGGKKLVGLKIGASQIAAAYVHSNGSHEVLKLARTPLERGVVVAGELRDPDALGVALKAFFNENKLPKRNIRLGIASNRVGVRVLDVPGVEDPALLGNAVRFRAQEVLPIPLSEAVLDYRVLRERRDDEGNLVREVLVAFAYRELVDRYADVCRSAGLRLIGIDLDGFALLRALVDPSVSNSRLGGAAVVTVALGHDRSIMSISNGDACEFTRVIDWGGASLDTAVARILALTPSQAEPIKRQLTLDSTAPTPEGLAPDQASRARSAMGQEVGAFAREFVSSLQFYQSQPRSLDIGEIVLTGGMAHMAGLAQQLQELIGVTVRIGDPLGRVKLGKHVETEEAIGSFALAIGLGIED